MEGGCATLKPHEDWILPLRRSAVCTTVRVLALEMFSVDYCLYRLLLKGIENHNLWSDEHHWSCPRRLDTFDWLIDGSSVICM